MASKKGFFRPCAVDKFPDCSSVQFFLAMLYFCSTVNSASDNRVSAVLYSRSEGTEDFFSWASSSISFFLLISFSNASLFSSAAINSALIASFATSFGFLPPIRGSAPCSNNHSTIFALFFCAAKKSAVYFDLPTLLINFLSLFTFSNNHAIFFIASFSSSHSAKRRKTRSISRYVSLFSGLVTAAIISIRVLLQSLFSSPNFDESAFVYSIKRL